MQGSATRPMLASGRNRVAFLPSSQQILYTSLKWGRLSEAAKTSFKWSRLREAARTSLKWSRLREAVKTSFKKYRIRILRFAQFPVVVPAESPLTRYPFLFYLRWSRLHLKPKVGPGRVAEFRLVQLIFDRLFLASGSLRVHQLFCPPSGTGVLSIGWPHNLVWLIIKRKFVFRIADGTK